MTRAKGFVCAGAVVLLLAAGCASDYLNLAFLSSSTSGRDRVFTGSLESVSQSTEGALRQLEIATQVDRQEDAVRIHGTTAKGDRFTVVLTREKSDRGEHTRVRLEWEKTADDQMGLSILSLVESYRTR
jgi:hypothetical protein